MIFHHNRKKERDFQSEYAGVEKEVIDMDADIRRDNRKKVFRALRNFFLVAFLIFLVIFVSRGGYRVPQEVSLDDEYEIFVNGRIVSYKIQKNYQETYIPFLWSRVGEDYFEFDDLHDNSEIPISSSIPFVIERYGCYKEGKQVKCNAEKDMDQILQGNTEFTDYERKTLPIDGYVMKIYRSTCKAAGNPIYEGEVLSDLGKYLTEEHNYCISTEWKEDANTKTVILNQLSVG